jgi:hypothetical protein
MSRKPIDQQQPNECRQAMWDLIRKRITISSYDILYETCLTKSIVSEYLTALVNGEYLKRLYSAPADVPWDRKAHIYYTLINDTGHDAPRVRRDGTPVTQGNGRLQIWNAMQVLKTFSVQELAFNASTEQHTVAEAEAKTYCAALCKAGYLIGQANQRYQLISAKISGPHPPQIQRTKQIYDPNLRKVVWSQITGGAE